MVEQEFSKLKTRVRSPSPAPSALDGTIDFIVECSIANEFSKYFLLEIGRHNSALSRFIIWNMFEIVGNIYENPNLLKATNDR